MIYKEEYCPNCHSHKYGEYRYDGDKFCGNCGHPIEPLSEKERKKQKLIIGNLIAFAENMADHDCLIDDYPQQYRDGRCEHCLAIRALKGELFEYWDWKKGA